MRRVIVVGAAVAMLAAGVWAQGQRGTRVDPGAPCPPGTTATRPGICQAPELPPPSILDYRPRSTLVTSQHPVPRAKYPAIDVHGHPGNLTTPDAIDRIVKEMDRLNVRLMVVAENVSGTRLAQTLQSLAASPHRERFRVMGGVDSATSGPAGPRRPSPSSKPTSRRASSASARFRRRSA